MDSDAEIRAHSRPQAWKGLAAEPLGSLKDQPGGALGGREHCLQFPALGLARVLALGAA